VQQFRQEIIFRKAEEQQQTKKISTRYPRPPKTLIKMKSVKSTLSWLFILACSMHILTASTVTNTADQKSKPAQTKQAKAKKTNKTKGQTPLFKSLLNHL
jgi:hypothetical protein